MINANKRGLGFFILSFLFATLIAFGSIFQGLIFVAGAEEKKSLDNSYVLDDLKGVQIDGETFDLEYYSSSIVTATSNLSVFTFMEFGYCESEDYADFKDYGLYVYVYNPKREVIVTSSPLNTVQIGIANDMQSLSKKFDLQYVNSSVGADTLDLFYKFKVVLSEDVKRDILYQFVNNSHVRTYKLISLELVTIDDVNAKSYDVSREFKYSGFSKGYGSEDKPISIFQDEVQTLSLKPEATFYRPDSNNGKNEYTQDSLHSVYFSIPDFVVNKYDSLSAVHARWKEATLAPGLVTGNQEAYSAILEVLGQDMSSIENFFYQYLGAFWRNEHGVTVPRVDYHFGYSFNGDAYNGAPLGSYIRDRFGSYVNPLYFLFNSGEGVDSADSYVVSSKDIMAQMLESSENFGGSLVEGKYSEKIFSSVADQFTEKNIKATEDFSLSNVVVGDDLWSQLWGITVNDALTGIKAIQPVTKDDMNGTPEEICDRLKISLTDYNDFILYYNASKVNNETVYLFRYRVSDYVSQEATCLTFSTFDYYERDTNAYFFQQSVDLGFDIIDVTFSKDDVETVIPVVMTPMDIVHDGTPPLKTESDVTTGCLDGDFSMILRILFLVFIVWFLGVTGILKFILKFIWAVISFPFNLISSVSKKKKRKKHRRR